MLRVGVWEDSVFIGCVIYAQGGNFRIGDPYGLTQLQAAELVRVALREHQTPVSRILAIALKFVKQHCPRLRLIVSYADPSEGHHGGIYKANGWIYTGQTHSSTEFRLNGERLQKRAYTGQQFGGGKASVATLPSRAVKVKTPGKHKYLMPLDAEMREQVARLSKPYPRAQSADSGTAPQEQAAVQVRPERSKTKLPNGDSTTR